MLWADHILYFLTLRSKYVWFLFTFHHLSFESKSQCMFDINMPVSTWFIFIVSIPTLIQSYIATNIQSQYQSQYTLFIITSPNCNPNQSSLNYSHPNKGSVPRSLQTWDIISITIHLYPNLYCSIPIPQKNGSTSLKHVG